MVDVDDTMIEVHGHAKQTSHAEYLSSGGVSWRVGQAVASS